jgi:membrane protein
MRRLAAAILRSRPVRGAVSRSRRLVLPGFEGVPLYDVVAFFVRQMRQVGLNERAAAISFDFLMAVPPFFIVALKLLSHLPGSRRLYGQALVLVRQITPDRATYRLIKSVMDDFFSAGGSLLSFSIVLALYFASSAMSTVMRTFNKSMLHIERDRRGFLQLRWVAVKLTVYIIILILATTFVMVTQGQLMDALTGWLGMREASLQWLAQTLRLLFTFGLVCLSIGLIYRHAPSVGREWRFFSPGVLLASALIIGFSMVFSVWVNDLSSYNRIYGPIGSILVLMLLVYANSMVLLIGFELNVSIDARKRAARRHGAHHR